MYEKIPSASEMSITSTEASVRYCIIRDVEVRSVEQGA